MRLTMRLQDSTSGDIIWFPMYLINEPVYHYCRMVREIYTCLNVD